MDSAAAPASSVPLAARVVAPDAARGAMLLLIALANTTGYLFGPNATTALHAQAAPADLWTHAMLQVTVHQRVYPMFAFLFGYGLIQLASRQRAIGTQAEAIRWILLRRSGWLIVFGFAHVALLYSGDILSVYGLLGIVLALVFIQRSPTALGWWAVGLVAVFVLPYLAVMAGTPAQWPMVNPDTAITNWQLAAFARGSDWFATVAVQAFLMTLVPASAIAGMWAARLQLMERPAARRRTVLTLAIGGIALGWVSGALLVAAQLGVAPFSAFGGELTIIAMAAGVPCGIGYALVFGLIGAGRTTPRALERPLVAIGRRSMTSYLLQSILCAPLLAAWGLGRGAHLTDGSMALIAIAAWLVSLVLALVLERLGRRGPFETLLRRLSYRRSARPAGS